MEIPRIAVERWSAERCAALHEWTGKGWWSYVDRCLLAGGMKNVLYGNLVTEICYNSCSAPDGKGSVTGVGWRKLTVTDRNVESGKNCGECVGHGDDSICIKVSMALI